MSRCRCVVVPMRFSVLGVLFIALSFWTGSASAASSGSIGSWLKPTSSSGCPSAACTKVLSAVKAGVRIRTVPSQLTPSLAKTSVDILFPPTMANCGAGLTDVTQPACQDGTNSKAPRVALLGDSEAQTWAISMDAIARRTGYSLLALAKTECPDIAMSVQLPYSNSPYTSCSQFRKYAINRIKRFRPNIVVIATFAMQFKNLNGKLITPQDFATGLAKVIRDLSSPGRKIFVIGNPPHQNTSPPVCLAAHEQHVSACVTSPQEALSQYGQWQTALRAGASEAHAQYVDVLPWFCTSDTCPPIISDNEVYLDWGHMTSSYGVFLSQVLQSALGMKDKCSRPPSSCNSYTPVKTYSYYTQPELSALRF